MGIRFQIAAHQENLKTTQNRQNEGMERMLQSWSAGQRGPSVAARASLVGARSPGDVYGVLTLEQSDVPLDDVNVHMLMSRDLATARAERGAKWNPEDINTNDRFDLTANPKDALEEIVGWWGRTPGRALGGGTPDPVKNASRWFMMGADAGVDAVSDRVIRAGAQSALENGTTDLGAFFAGAVDEYVTGENIGNKPFWLALEKVFNGEELTLGSGFIAESVLAPDVQQAMDEYDAMSAERHDFIYDAYENEGQGGPSDEWMASNAQFANAYSQSTYMDTRGREAALAAAVANSEEQALYGDPITQQSQYKQEAFGGPVGSRGGFTTNEMDEQGRPYWSQVSMGRVGALMITEPGTTPYNTISGGVDFAKQIGYDPLNYVGLGALGKADDARRAVGLTTEGAQRAADAKAIEKAAMALRESPTVHNLDAVSGLKKAGVEPDADLFDAIHAAPSDAEGILLATRARKTVAPAETNRFMTGAQAAPMVEALANADSMRAVDAILSSTKGRISSTMRGQLRRAETEGEVIDILLPRIQEMSLKGNMNATARLASYDNLAKAVLDRPVNSLLDMGFAIVNQITETGFDAMYQIQQKGLNPFNKLNEFVPREVPNIGVRAQARNIYGNTWGGRMVNNQSNAAIRTSDIDSGYNDVTRLLRNGSVEADSKFVRTNTGRVIEGATREAIEAQVKVGESINWNSLVDVDDTLFNFSQLNNGNGSGAYDQVRKVYEAIDMKMDMDGVPEVFRRAVTTMIEGHGDQSKFFTNATGQVKNYPGVGFSATLDGMQTIVPGPQLISEMYSGAINVPDPRLLRRTLAENNVFTSILNAATTKKKILPKIDMKGSGFDEVFDFRPRGTLEDAALLRASRVMISNVWKPAKLLRFGYIPKVLLGDEQARMMAAGLSALWAPGRLSKGDSPLAYFAYLLADPEAFRGFIAKKAAKVIKAEVPGSGKVAGAANKALDVLPGRGIGPEDVKGARMAAAREMQDTVSLNGNAFGETGAMHADTWDAVALGTPEYADGLATEIVQLSDDPLVRFMFSDAARAGDPMTTTKNFLLNDEEGQRILNVIARKIAEKDPNVARMFRNGEAPLDNYLDWVYARGHLKAGGDYVYRDPSSGVLLDSSNNPLRDADFPQAHDGITIIRQGRGDIMEAYSTGVLGGELDDAGEIVGGVKTAKMNDEDYAQLRKTLDGIIEKDIATGNPQLPANVKYNSSQFNGHDSNMAKNIVDFLMDHIVSKPAEYLNRSPAFRQLYWEAVGTRYNMMTDSLQETVKAQAKSQGTWGRVRSSAKRSQIKGGQPRTLDTMDDVDLYAKSWAATATKDLLFDFAERKNFFDAMSLVSPFADAWLELFTAWGRLFGQDPRIVRRPLKALDELRKNDPTEWGEGERPGDEGFFHQNQYGEEVFTLPMSAEIVSVLEKSKYIDDLPDFEMEIATESLNMVAGQFYPGVGPAVTIPAASAIPKTGNWQRFREILAPFGMEDSSFKELTAETLGASPTLNRFLNAYTQGSFLDGDGERAFNNTAGWMMKDMLTSGEYTYEQLQDPDIQEEIVRVSQERASQVYFIRGLTQFFAPASPGSPDFLFTDEAILEMDEVDRPKAIALQDASKTYYDILENEADGDHQQATTLFTERYGFDPIGTLVSSSEAISKRGVTKPQAMWERDHEEYFGEFPNTAYYLGPLDQEDDEFWSDAWNDQFTSGAREEKPLEDQLNEYMSRMGTIELKNAEREFDEIIAGTGTSLDDKAIEDLKATVLDAVKADIIERNPDYEATVGTYTASERQAAISELRNWQNYNALDGDETQVAVTQFMSDWDEAFEAQLGIGIGSKTANVLPFTRQANVKVGGENWTKRMIINTALLETGDELARESNVGNFADVWQDLIRPAIYDYRQDTEPEAVDEPDGSDVERLLEEAFG